MDLEGKAEEAASLAQRLARVAALVVAPAKHFTNFSYS
jgi:hypothetical protein